MRRSCLLVASLTMLLVGATLACGGALEGPVTGIVERGPRPTEGLRMVYLGTGGWIMEYRGAQVIAGPLFSNPGLLRTGLADIESDTALVDRYMSAYDVAEAKAILVGHAHYDHLMDVPRVAAAHAPDARILGSRTVRNTLGTWSGLAGRVDLLEDAAGDEETVGRWLSYGDRVRIMPLRSMHGPHFDGLTLYRGTVDTPLEEPPRRASEWLDGATYAFLVDFLSDDGDVAFRIYYQDAVAPPPLGFAPEELVDERPVDVAVLVPATFEEVPWHPEAVVANLRPRRVLLGHWEDFFRPVERDAEPVPLTDLPEFERRLGRVFDGEVFRPDRFAEFRFGRRSDDTPPQQPVSE
ncbi:MAG: hypothetical protein U5R14_12125 [Gemmatimonadota bacterium]|nr:hypothetical protein [Gemmatimonadota bacterium]